MAQPLPLRGDCCCLLLRLDAILSFASVYLPSEEFRFFMQVEWQRLDPDEDHLDEKGGSVVLLAVGGLPLSPVARN
jgi:hypothetical protein